MLPDRGSSLFTLFRMNDTSKAFVWAILTYVMWLHEKLQSPRIPRQYNRHGATSPEQIFSVHHHLFQAPNTALYRSRSSSGDWNRSTVIKLVSGRTVHAWFYIMPIFTAPLSSYCVMLWSQSRAVFIGLVQIIWSMEKKWLAELF